MLDGFTLDELCDDVINTREIAALLPLEFAEASKLVEQVPEAIPQDVSTPQRSGRE